MLPWVVVACFVGYHLTVARAVHSLEHPNLKTAEGLVFAKLWREVPLADKENVPFRLVLARELVYVGLIAIPRSVGWLGPSTGPRVSGTAAGGAGTTMSPTPSWSDTRSKTVK